MERYLDFRVIFRRWGWLLYPVAAVVVGVGTLRFGLNQITVQEEQRQAKENARLVSDLRQKLQLLSEANPIRLEQDTQWLLTVMPSQRQPARLLAQVNQAASLSGVIIAGLKGQRPTDEGSGQRVTVAVTVGGFADLVRFIAAIEKMLPLVRIKDVDFQANAARVEVEEVWLPLPRLATTSATLVLPSSPVVQVEQLRTRLASYIPVVTTASGEATVSANPNPFVLAQ